MTTPPPPPEDAIPLSRLAMWLALLVVLLFGLMQYFRYARSIIPLLGLPS